MGRKKTHLKLHPITEGAILLESSTESALFGCPPEILKLILLNKLPIPNTVVLPAVLHHGSCSQAVMEFLFFYYLFLYNGIKKHGKFRFFATATQCQQLKAAIHNVVLGPTKKEMLARGMPKKMAQQLAKEMEYMAPQNPETHASYQLEEMMEWHVLETGQSLPLFEQKTLGTEILIQRKGNTTFHVNYLQETLALNIAIKQPQRPPYIIQHKPHVRADDALTVTVLGASDGFDPQAPANGYLFDFNGRLGIWDCPSYLHCHLQKLKIDYDQIEALILSHVHEDHIDVVESLRPNNPLDLYCTSEVYHGLLLKIMAIMACSLEEAQAFHHWHPVEINKTHSILGASFEFFYSVHAIPTTGCRVTIPSGSQNKALLISSDHAPFWVMRDMKLEGVLSDDRFHQATHLVTGNEDLILIDAGGGTIHGNYKDYMDLDAKIHFMHTGHLPRLSPSKVLVKHADVLDFASSS